MTVDAARKALNAVAVPESCRLAEPLPDTVTPAHEVAAKVPAGAPKVSSSAALPASVSPTEITGNGVATSSTTTPPAGSVKTGASFTAVTSTLRVALSVRLPSSR